MMTGFLQQWEQEKRYYPKAFDAAFSFLADNNLEVLAKGKHLIDGERIFVTLQDTVTEPICKRRFELHQQYLDIQILIQGAEKHGYVPRIPVHTPLEDCLASRDVAFYPHPDHYEALTLVPGQFAVYLPFEQHCPNCAVFEPEPIRKAVVKIHISCIH